MAKKKAKKLPKRVGGVKIPKMVRKSSLLRSLLASRFGRDLLANALVAGAGAAAAILVKDPDTIAKTGKKGTKKSARAVSVAGEAIQSAISAAVGVVREHMPGSFPDAAHGKKRNPATAH